MYTGNFEARALFLWGKAPWCPLASHGNNESFWRPGIPSPPRRIRDSMPQEVEGMLGFPGCYTYSIIIILTIIMIIIVVIIITIIIMIIILVIIIIYVIFILLSFSL